MKKGVYIDRYIETSYFRLFNNNSPVSVVEFNAAFATTKFYNSKAPVARHGLNDFRFSPKDRLEYCYDSSFFDCLVEKERYAIVDRVAFYTLMRAMLPSFKLIVDDKTEINVDAFASIYEDGYCSITYIYSCNENSYDERFEDIIGNWSKIIGICINKNLYDMLKFENDTVGNDFEEVCIPIEVFFSAIEYNDKFLHNIIIIQTILASSADNFVVIEGDVAKKTKREDVHYSTERFPHIYRYYQFSARTKMSDDTLNYIRKIIEQLGNKPIFNPLMTETLTDLTIYQNYQILINSSYLICFRKTLEEYNENILVPFFIFSDYALLQKHKAITALVQFKRIEKLEEQNVNTLLELKKALIANISVDILYDFSYIKEEVAAKTIFDCINTNAYIEELRKVYSRIEQELLTKEQRDKEEQQSWFNKRIQIITLILTIPSVSVIVDIFYQIDCTHPIVFSIGLSKLLWTIFTLLLSVLLLQKKR